jgi:hypothetical protein
VTIHSPRRIACANERTTALDTGRFVVFAASNCEALSGVIVCTLLRTQNHPLLSRPRIGRPPQPTRHDRTQHPVTPDAGRTADARTPAACTTTRCRAGSTTPGHRDVVRFHAQAARFGRATGVTSAASPPQRRAATPWG